MVSKWAYAWVPYEFREKLNKAPHEKVKTDEKNHYHFFNFGFGRDWSGFMEPDEQ